MDTDLRVGDFVRLLGVPEWLLHDLPADEQIELRSYVGRSARIEKIDEHGYYWLGFGKTAEHEDVAFYTGHSFAVERDFIEPA